MRHTAIGLLFAASLSLLNAGCGSSSAVAGAGGPSSGGNGVLPPGAVPQTRYDMANGCYGLKSLSASTSLPLAASTARDLPADADAMV